MANCINADKATQCQKVLKYMEEHGSINYKIAIYKLGITRLASRISDLKKSGKIISKEMVAEYDDDGKFVCNHVEYSLIKEIRDENN